MFLRVFSAGIFQFARVLIAIALTINLCFSATITVDDNGNDGVGTLRDAIENQFSSGDVIEFHSSITTITLDNGDPISYSGTAPLTIDASSPVLIRANSASNTSDLLVCQSNRGVDFSNIRFLYGGIEIKTDSSYTSSVIMDFDGVQVTNANGDGVLITDDRAGLLIVSVFDGLFSSNGDDGFNIFKTNATAGLFVENSDFISNGFEGLKIDFVKQATFSGTFSIDLVNSNFDANGEDNFEIEEAGSGSIIIEIDGCDFTDTSSDHIDVCETGGGDINLTIKGESLLDGFLPDADESDGVKVEEIGDGYVDVTIIEDTTIRNMERDGIRVVELGNGNLDLNLNDIFVNSNEGDGIMASESGGGTLAAYLEDVDATFSGDEGIQLEELGDGNLDFEITSFDTRSELEDNGGDGIRVVGDGQGTVNVDVDDTSIIENGDDGIQINNTAVAIGMDSSLEGSTTVSITDCDITLNDQIGIKAFAGDAAGSSIFIDGTITDYEGNDVAEFTHANGDGTFSLSGIAASLD